MQPAGTHAIQMSKHLPSTYRLIGCERANRKIKQIFKEQTLGLGRARVSYAGFRPSRDQQQDKEMSVLTWMAASLLYESYWSKLLED
jgi:hypothetical protein